MSAIQLSVERNTTIDIQARITITADPPPPADPVVRLTVTTGGVSFTQTGATKMAYTLPADKMVQLQIAFVDANGNPANVDGAVRWESSNPEIADVTPAEGMVVDLVPGVDIGNCQITAHADADLGSGIRELVTLLDVTVVGGEAVAGVITPVGEPTPKP